MSPADLQRLIDALQGERLKTTVPAVEDWIQEWGQKQLDALGVSARTVRRRASRCLRALAEAAPYYTLVAS